jgi:hypothetical protein
MNKIGFLSLFINSLIKRGNEKERERERVGGKKWFDS